jgi:L-ascorbate metabolism protein UlaG (beta-lactamase superfamily)
MHPLPSSKFSPDDQVFLQPEVKLELLAFRWYAWPHLIPPLQHAMNLAFRHIPLLRSFLANPTVHIKAAADPALLGGPFVDLPMSELKTVESMLADIIQGAAPLLALAHEYKEFDQLLQGRARGCGMDELYQLLPPTLRGCAELFYDLNNHPQLRIIERMLYDLGLNETRGREICLTTVKDSQRKFFLTTPRIDGSHALFLTMGFADQRIDVLATMRTKSIARGEMTNALSVDLATDRKLDQFLTTTAPTRNSPDYCGDGVRVRYFGHACVLLQTSSVSILLDPLTAWERDLDQATLTFNDLPDRIDFAIFSHTHMDHFCPEMIVQLRRRVGTFIVPQANSGDVADPSMKSMLRAMGVENVQTVEVFDRIGVQDGEIVSLPFPGEHCGLSITSKHSISIRLAGKRFLFLVDSDAVDPVLYERLSKHLGDLDALFVGMECHGSPLTWFYGPLLTRQLSRKEDESRRGNASNCARAMNAIRHIRCTNVFVYAMGNEPWNRHLLGLEYSPDSIQVTEADALIRTCIQEGRNAERLRGCREMRFV